LRTADPRSRLTALTSPAAANDNRVATTQLPTGQPVAGDNFAATEEPGELRQCQSDRGLSPFGRTVWYRWTAPAEGTAVFVASGFDTVLTVHRADSGAVVSCDDDPSAAADSRVEIPVTAGDYLV
jgi:hypothetical protein